MAAQAGFIRHVRVTKPETLSGFAQLKLIGVREEGSMIGTKTAFPIQLQRKGSALPRLLSFLHMFCLAMNIFGLILFLTLAATASSC